MRLSLGVLTLLLVAIKPLKAQSSFRDLEKMAGTRVCGTDLIRSPLLRRRLALLMGPDLHQLTSRAMMCGFTVDARGTVLLARNMRAHQGTVEESMLLINRATNEVEVKLLHEGKIYTYAEPGHRFTPPIGWRDADGWCVAREVPGRVPTGP